MEEIKRRGRPRKMSTELPSQEGQVTVTEEKKTTDVPQEKSGQKTVMEYLAEFKNRKTLEIPKEISKKYPEMHFVWARNDEDNITKKEGNGYELVHMPELAARRVGVKGYRTLTDDLVRYGDLVLMMCPVNYYIARETKKELDIEQMNRKLKNPENLQKEAVKSSKGDVQVSVMESRLNISRG